MTGSQKPPPRLYIDGPLDTSSLVLEAERAHYLGRVLRCREGDEIIVFNARGTECSAVIESLAKRRPVIMLGTPIDPLPEPVTPILLLQALVKSDAMDLIIQKATELGVASVYAAKTDFSVVRLDQERQGRRLEHWRRVATSACEQCGRHCPPDFQIFNSLDQAIAALPAGSARIAFDTIPAAPLDTPPDKDHGVSLAIGPEGGFSPDESQMLAAQGFAVHSLGPRILRAETAAIAAVVSAQMLIGGLVNGSV
jgi:16S rRNA (uracil1498-N3)-methyltransferase